MDRPWERLMGGLVLGSVEFAQSLLRGQKTDLDEPTEARRLRRRIEWTEIVLPVIPRR